MASLTVRALEHRFDDVYALRDVSFDVGDGRVAALLGPSGCGKTTILRLIAGLERPHAGDILIDGDSVLRRPPHRRGVGLMFQELALFPHLDVRQNIEFGLRMAKWSRGRRGERVEQLLALAGLEGLGGRRVHELSGGERQRVALARTLAPEPQVLLLDEPLGSLDEELKRDLRVQLRAMLGKLRTTALIVSHDLRDAVAVADDLIVMDRGSVLQAGELPDVLAGPASVKVAHMLGYVTLVDGLVEDGRVVEDGVGSIEVPRGLPLTGRVQALAHPATLLAVPAGRGLGCGVDGTVLASRPDGPMQVLEVSLDDRRVASVRWEWDTAPVEAGVKVDLAARPETLRLFRTPVEEITEEPAEEPPEEPAEEPEGEPAEEPPPESPGDAEGEPAEEPPPEPLDDAQPEDAEGDAAEAPESEPETGEGPAEDAPDGPATAENGEASDEPGDDLDGEPQEEREEAEDRPDGGPEEEDGEPDQDAGAERDEPGAR